MRPDGFVLAGGAGSRMGFDKARAQWGEVPLAVAVAAVAEACCERVALVRRGPPDGLPWVRADGSALPVLREPEHGARHPLWGVATALQAARSPVALILACDVPHVAVELLRALTRDAPAVARAAGRRHPLVAAFPVAWAGRASELAAAGGSVRDFARGAASVDAPVAQLLNVNEPGELPPDGAARLVRRLPFLRGDARARAVAGELVRLAARGILGQSPTEGSR